MRRDIKLGTRASLLAVTQSTWVKNQIEKQYPDTTVELVKITTKGDKILDVPLAKVGGKGLFVKELEDALLEGSVDLAVHSMKDVPSMLPEGLQVAIVPVRENPHDAFISIKYKSLDEMPTGAKIGTSSLRRKAQLAGLRPDLEILDLRGNLDTRLRKLEEGLYDAIILAAAGLNRLGMTDKITTLFTAEQMLPAVGQGSLGIELRETDTELIQGLHFLHHKETAVTVAAERAFLLTLEGGCQVPIGAFASINGPKVTLTGLIASEDGSEILRDKITGNADTAEKLGITLAEKLLDLGGRRILDVVYGNQSTEK
jgi:hydroxymethylbilane synthase